MARGRGRTIDYKVWLAIPSSNATVSTNTTTGGGSLAFSGPGTILRCRGFVQAHFDATVQVGDILGLTFALGIVSTDAATVGATVLPDPTADADYPWLWWGDMILRSELAAGPGAWGISAQRLEVDTKAMRRFKPNESLIWVMQSSIASGAPATEVSFGQTRVLIGT